MIVSGSNFDDILEEKIDDIASKQNFDKIKANKIEAGDGIITVLASESAITDELRVNWDTRTDASTMKVEDNEINFGSGKAVVVNVEGTLKYNGHNLEALIAAGGAGQPIDITHINNQSVTTNALTTNGTIHGRELEIYKHQNQSYPFQVWINDDINGYSEVYIGKVSNIPAFVNSKTNLFVNGNATINETLTVRGDIVDAQNRTIQQQVQGFTDAHLQGKVDFGIIKCTSLEKTKNGANDFVKLGYAELIKVNAGNRHNEVSLTQFIQDTSAFMFNTWTNFGDGGKTVTIKDNIIVPLTVKCQSLTLDNMKANAAETNLGRCDKIKLSWNLDPNHTNWKEGTLNQYLTQRVLVNVETIGKDNGNLSFPGNVSFTKAVKTNGGITSTGLIKATGGIEANGASINCGSLRATNKINVGAGEQCYMDNNGGKMVCNNFEKLNYKTNATGKIKLGLPDHILIYNAKTKKDESLLTFFENNAPELKSAKKLRNFGTDLATGDIVIGNDKVDNTAVLSKQLVIPTTDKVFIKGTKTTLKDLFDAASKGGGGGGSGVDLGTATEYSNKFGNKQAVTFGSNNVSELDVTAEKIKPHGVIDLTDGNKVNIYANYDYKTSDGSFSRTFTNGFFSDVVTKIIENACDQKFSNFGTEQNKPVFVGPVNANLHLKGNTIYIGNNDSTINIYGENISIGKKDTTVYIKEVKQNSDEDQDSCETFTLGELVNAVKGKYTKEVENGEPLETQILPGWVTTDNATVNDQFTARDATITGDLIVESITSEGDYITVKCPVKMNGDVELDGSLKAHSLSATHAVKAAQGDFESISVNSIDCDVDELPMKKIRLSNPLQDAVINRDNATGSYTHKLGANLADPSLWVVRGIGFFNIAFHRITEFIVMVTGPIHVDFDSDSIERINSKKFSCSNFFAEATENIFPAPLIKECLHDVTIPFNIKVSYTNSTRTYPAKLKITLTEVSIEYDESTKPDDFFEDWSETNLLKNVELIPGDAFIHAPTAQTLAAYNIFYKPDKAPIIEKYT